MSNAREWAIEIDAEFARTMDDVREFVIDLATTALAKVKEHSPVAQPWAWKRPVRGYIGGQFRANWVISVGGINGQTVPFPGAGFGGQNASALATFAAAEGWPVIYIQNNLPYAEALENGHSAQRPLGIVAITIPELEAMAQGREI